MPGPAHQDVERRSTPGRRRRPRASRRRSGPAASSRRYGFAGGRRPTRPPSARAGPPPSATTTARATASVWVSERCQRATPARRASGRGGPVQDAARRRPGRPGPPPRRGSGRHPSPTPEGLHDRLLGGEPGGQPGHRVGGRPGVGPLPGGEQPVGQRGPALEDPCEPVDVHGVDPHAHHAGRRPTRPRGRGPSSGPARSPERHGHRRSLDGDHLGQVAGPVDVEAVQAGQ